MGGLTEVAGVLGVSRQRVSRLRERPDFPDPIGELAQGAIWDLDAVQAWNDSGLRSAAGRPSAAVAARTLGARFVLEEKIGSGGFADVYRAKDRKRAGEPAAVKILRDVGGVDPESLRRFRRELRLLEGLHHPNVIEVLAHGETDDEGIWYAMPLAQGSLADALDDVASQSADILAIMRQVGSGLSHLHAEGIFHRDLKPANILRIQQGWAISDFGLAAELERATTVLTSTGREGLGSYWFTAPEQWASAREADHVADIYSLGKVLQALVTGAAPISSDLPASPLRPIIERATSHRPRDRHRSVVELLVAVEAALGAPQGRWESAEDAAKRLLELVRLPKPAVEDLDDLLAWASSLDETEAEDMQALTRVLPWISTWSIRTMDQRDPVGLGSIFSRFCDHVSDYGFPFDYCDVLADFIGRACRQITSRTALRSAVHALAELGHNHNRWHVREVLVALLQSLQDDEAAIAAVEGLRAAGPDATEWSVQNFTLRSLHPTLRGAIAHLHNEHETEDA